MKFNYTFALACAVIAVCSCKPKIVSERPVIDYVSEVIEERANPANKLLSSFDAREANANIVVFGPLEEVRPLAGAFLMYDRFDNVDARPVRDSLPDFAGEVITRVIMADAKPLEKLRTDDDQLALRELAVKAALACLDTASFRTPGDLSSYSHKVRGKAVVLTSSAMAAFGKYDVDSLFRSFGIEDAVFFPLELMADRAFAKPETRIGIVSEQSAELYDEFFKYRDDAAGHFIGVFPKESVLGEVSVVDSLALDILLMDDYSVPADSLRKRFPKVEVITPGEVACEACFKAMRSRNIFTHRVAYPRRETYTALIRDDSEYILIDSDDRELF